MPKITISLNDFQKLNGKTISTEKLKEILSMLKGDLESQHEDELTLSMNDTNLPHLWSVEGIARHSRGILGLETGLPNIEIQKSGYSVIVDPSVRAVRPCIASFVAKGPALTEQLLISLVQLQEKLSEHYGRRRQKVSIGLYPAKAIEFPITYKAVEPDRLSFIPLEGRTETTLKEVVRNHPKGKTYGWILANAKKYPVLLDNRKNVLSLPPIINSEQTGRLTPGDTDLFFDATGMTQDAVNLVATIVAYALYDRGYKIYPCIIRQGGKSIQCPNITPIKIKINEELISSMLGMTLSKTTIQDLLKKARCDAKLPLVQLPAYRQDIMHPVDIVEEAAIMYGFSNILEQQLTSYTVGKPLQNKGFLNAARHATALAGYVEVLSPVLSNKDIQHDRMLTPVNSIELTNPVSTTYTSVRSGILPGLLELLGKNRHADYPQRAFEQGRIVTLENEKILDTELLAAVTCNSKADITDIRQLADNILRPLGIQYTLLETEHKTFIQGRAANIIVKGTSVGILGEIHPLVLSKFNIEQPVAALEIDLTKLQNNS